MSLQVISLRFHLMIDFVKALILHAIHLRDNPFLKFTNKVDTSTGELSQWWVAEYHGLKFESHDSGLVLMTGSLHKYFNKGKHNWNQFTHNDLSNTLKEISILFDLDLVKCVLQNTEIGVNLVEPFDIQNILNGLMLHSTIEFDSGYQGCYRQCKHSEYYIKVYNKSKQYDIKMPIMRFELKFVKMRFVNSSLNIYTLGCLLKEDWIEKAKELLLKRWNEIVFFDYSFKGQLDSEMLQIVNPVFWSGWNKMERKRKKEKLKVFNRNHSLNHQLLVSNAIASNIDKLQNVTFSPFNYRVIS